MVKLTDEQKRELEALRNMPDDQIDLSDIPERPIDWSKAKIAPFYRPIWKDFSLRLHQSALDCLEQVLDEGQTLDNAVNNALGAEMFRIRFPVRVHKAEKRIRRIQESPGEIENLFEAHKQEIEILYGKAIEEVAASEIPLQPMSQSKHHGQPIATYTSLTLDENIIDWYEYRLDDGQSLDEALNQALMDHIRWVTSSRDKQPQNAPAESTLESP